MFFELSCIVGRKPLQLIIVFLQISLHQKIRAGNQMIIAEEYHIAQKKKCRCQKGADPVRKQESKHDGFHQQNGDIEIQELPDQAQYQTLLLKKRIQNGVGTENQQKHQALLQFRNQNQRKNTYHTPEQKMRASSVFIARHRQNETDQHGNRIDPQSEYGSQ